MIKDKQEKLKLLKNFWEVYRNKPYASSCYCPFHKTKFERTDCKYLCGEFFPEVKEPKWISCPCHKFGDMGALIKLENLLRKEEEIDIYAKWIAATQTIKGQVVIRKGEIRKIIEHTPDNYYILEGRNGEGIYGWVKGENIQILKGLPSESKA